jgi:preprotein translocase subunit YajC
MIEILEIFWSAKIELRVVILATLVIGCGWYFQDYRRKQKEKKQERLNEIKNR